MTVSTADRLRETAQRLIQTNGYNGFSFRDLATEIGIKSASIHYHFPTKGDLARDVAQQYRKKFADRLEQILQDHDDLPARLAAYSECFSETLRNGNRLCLCGMLASESDTLPQKVHDEARLFFAEQVAWLELVIADDGPQSDETRQFAATYLSALEGAMMIARATGETDRIARTSAQLIDMHRKGRNERSVFMPR